jgi:hypothetical protein
MSSALHALEAMMQYQDSINAVANEDFENLFKSEEPFLDKVKTFDHLMKDHKQLVDIEEFLFDLLMVHHLSTHVQDEDYFDTKEWLDIEDKTIERGSELLNLLLYITECKDTDVEVSLEDFLHEFLLVDEDEFQDEHRIYEPLIEYQEAEEFITESVREIEKAIPEQSEIKQLFVPIVLFFQEAENNSISATTDAMLTVPERSLLACLMNYYKY